MWLVFLFSLCLVHGYEYQLYIHAPVSEQALFYHSISRYKDTRLFYTGQHGLDYLVENNIPHALIHTQHTKSVSGFPGYTTQDQLESKLQRLSTQYPHIASTFVIGKSALGQSLLGIRIRNPNNTHVPAVNYMANIHGDEVVGREMLILLADYLVQSYGSNPRIRKLVDQTDIWLLPSANPDGFTLQRRTNANGYDLNRNFPDRFYGNPRVFQPETRAIMEWQRNNHFVLSVSGHGGDLVVNLPWNNNKQHKSGIYTPTPDEIVFKDVAKTFSFAHHKMHASAEFPNGITNGCCYQDFVYANTSSIPLTIELSFPKHPPASSLTSYWQDSREAFVALLERVHGPCVYGKTTPLANVHVLEIDHVIQANQYGYYRRLLVPGTWHIRSNNSGNWKQVLIKDKAVRMDL